MWLTHFWHTWSQFFIFAWDVTAGGILRTGVLICLVKVCILSVYNEKLWHNQNVIVFLMQMQKLHTDPECLLSHESHVEIKSCSKASYLIYKVSIWAEMETCTVCFSLISDSQHASDITKNYSDVKANILIWCSFPFEGDGNPWTRCQHLGPISILSEWFHGSWRLLMGIYYKMLFCNNT